ncbi:DUF2268 domain-containing protein [Brevibacillus laterosporus]|uniref:DUF2268 domain-containing protein n=1 Tax=Brevibacillus laterosporus TaxID=1465 RepID=UPI00264ABFF0|nr:DUF2268 domain-containing putative Zn-dependent protease [Brevibacillus laterosporus]MDN9010599.1 DUF2268 domain-containing putative Zn-dependent protease [Brevibacillus laterosporus]MDO0941492.1 DUF2268 domain-containing putative Zn-dependent protease [Brevibacillus laterosporus]
MSNASVVLHDTASIYKQMLDVSAEEQIEMFRYKLMKPFEAMWKTIGVPLKAPVQNGYDVIMASQMLGLWVPSSSDSSALKDEVLQLEQIHANHLSERVLEEVVEEFSKIGYNLPLEEIHYALFIGDRMSKEMQFVQGYSGFAGIPGYIQIYICPNDYTLPRLPHVIAHEFNHQVRFCYEPFRYGDVSVGEYIVIEGLAESFAVHMYGEERIGPWVTHLVGDELAYSTRVIRDSLHVRGFSEVRSYLFGDDLADKMGYQRVGLSPYAGYGVGYHLVQAYLKKTGKSIMEATLTPANQIIAESCFFE